VPSQIVSAKKVFISTSLAPCIWLHILLKTILIVPTINSMRR
jgi:hypothetical protein